MDLSNVTVPVEGVKHLENNTSAYVGASSKLGEGTLCISENSLVWSRVEDGLGFQLAYPNISLHATSRDRTNFHADCLYLMVDKDEGEGFTANNVEGEDEEEEEQDPNLEIRFVPSDSTKLEAMYKALCECQLLHPDPDDVDSNEEGEEDDEGCHLDDGGETNGFGHHEDEDDDAMDVSQANQFEDV